MIFYTEFRSLRKNNPKTTSCCVVSIDTGKFWMKIAEFLRNSWIRRARLKCLINVGILYHLAFRLLDTHGNTNFYIVTYTVDNDLDSFLIQLSTWDIDELKEKLEKRVQVSKQNVEKMMISLYKLLVRTNVLQKMQKKGG